MPRRLLALTSGTVLLAGLGIAAAPAALAADPDTSASHASAQFVSGTWNTAGVHADFDGATSAGTQVASNALASLVAGGAIDVGVGSEYAEASTGGASWAASGAVTAAGMPTRPATVDIDLGKILEDAGIRNGIVEKLTLSLQGIAGVTKLDAQTFDPAVGLASDCGADWTAATNCRDYTLKSGELHIGSNALKAAMGEVQGLAAAIDSAIGTYYDGPLDDSIANVILAPINQWLVDNVVVKTPKTTGVTHAAVDGADLDVSIGGTVASALATILSAPHTVNGVVLNLGDGTIDVDYDTVMGGLNGLDPNTPLFGTAVVDSVTASLNAIVDDIAGEIAAAVPTLLDAVTVSVTGNVTGTVATEAWLPASKWTPAVPLGSSHSTLTIGVTYTGTMWQLLHGGGQITFSGHAPDDVLIDTAIKALFLVIPQPIDLSTLVPGGLFGGAVDPAIATAIDSAAAGAKSIGGAVITSLAGILNGASDVFGGTINVQEPLTPSPFRASPGAFRAAPAAAPAPGGAFSETALRLYFGPVGARTTVNLGTATVGPNRTVPICAAGTHYDPTTGLCAPDGATPGGGTPGGGAPTSTSTPTSSPATPAVDVAGESDEIIPAGAVAQPTDIAVKGESSEATDETVAALAETGPHQTGLIMLVGLELLLAGIAVTRLAARRGRARHSRG